MDVGYQSEQGLNVSVCEQTQSIKTIQVVTSPGSCRSTAEPSWLSLTSGSSIRTCLRLLKLPLRPLTLGEQVHNKARGTDTHLTAHIEESRAIT